MKGAFFIVMGLVVILICLVACSGSGNGSSSAPLPPPPQKSKVNVMVTDGFVITEKPDPLHSNYYENGLRCQSTCTDKANEQQRELNQYLENGYVVINKMPQDYSSGLYCVCKGELYVLEK